MPLPDDLKVRLDDAYDANYDNGRESRQGEVEAAEARASAAVAKTTEVQAAYDEHMKSHAPPPPPPPPPSKTLVGLSLGAGAGTDAEKLKAMEAQMGKLGAVRHYFSGDIGTWANVKALIGDRPVVVSYKSASLTNAKAFMAAADVETYICVNHEPENGDFSNPADYRVRMAALRDAAAQVGNPKVHATQILMMMDTRPGSGRKVSDWWVSGVVHAWDGYNFDFDKGVYLPPEQLYGAAVKLSKDAGEPVAFAEWGSQMVAGDNGTRRAAWITVCDVYFKSVGARFHTYWNTKLNVPDFRLLDQPSKDAYRKAMGN